MNSARQACRRSASRRAAGQRGHEDDAEQDRPQRCQGAGADHARTGWFRQVHVKSRLWRSLLVARRAVLNEMGTIENVEFVAASAVAVIAAKRQTIRSPGGYLRGMIGRAQNGELHLSNSLWGLAQRERSRGTYDA